MRRRRVVFNATDTIDETLVARGAVVERYGLPEDGQGIASALTMSTRSRRRLGQMAVLG